MRTRNARVVFVGLAAAAVVVVGSIALRDGPLGGGGASASQDPTLTAAGAGPLTAPAPSIRPLGSMSERLARLPPVAPGELDGILDLGGDDCLLQTIALATLVRTGTPPGLCAAPGGRFAVRLNDLVPRQLDVVDMSGRSAETIAVPDGWDWAGITRQGVVLCKRQNGPARVRRFGGETVPLPSCPISQNRDGLLFAGPRRQSVVDEHGRRVAVLQRPLTSQSPFVRTVGDRLLVVENTIYRDGRVLASFGERDGRVIGASRDGKVALVSDGVGTRLYVYRDGTVHAIDRALSTHGGVVAPDGRRLLLQHDDSQLVELDAVTLRPVARLDLAPAAQVFDWRS